MVIDLKEVKGILETEIVQPMDHRHLNYEVPPFDHVVPTVENLAIEIWRRLEPRFAATSGQPAERPRPRGRRPFCRLRRAILGDAHDQPHPPLPLRVVPPLHSPMLSDAENRAVYGKCNNPHGHGHDYTLEVSVTGEPRPHQRQASAARASRRARPPSHHHPHGPPRPELRNR